MSNFWFAKTEHLIANHIVDAGPGPEWYPELDWYYSDLEGRTVLVRNTRPLTIEVNGRWVNALHLFANPPESRAPSPGDPNVRGKHASEASRRGKDEHVRSAFAISNRWPKA
jgi:hypothetical protein